MRIQRIAGLLACTIVGFAYLGACTKTDSSTSKDSYEAETGGDVAKDSAGDGRGRDDGGSDTSRGAGEDTADTDSCAESGAACEEDGECCGAFNCKEGTCTDCARDGEACENRPCCDEKKSCAIAETDAGEKSYSCVGLR